MKADHACGAETRIKAWSQKAKVLSSSNDLAKAGLKSARTGGHWVVVEVAWR